MALPDGSMVLICPTGPEYSQVEQSDFDDWSSNPYFHVEEISAELFSIWFSNVKRVTTLYEAEYDADPGGNVTYASNGIQWRVEPGTMTPLEANTGNHPFPRMRFPGAGGSGYETIYNTSDEFRYVNEEYPTDAYNAGLPEFFIHKDKFYLMTPLEYPSDVVTVTVTLTSGFYKIVYLDPGVSTITYTITIDPINGLFYP